MSGKRFHIVIALLVAILMSSCSIRRFIPEGQNLVKSNKVVIEEKHTKLSKSDISKYISLKPYKSTLQTNLPTWCYYQSERHPKSAFWKWVNKNFGNEPVYYDKIGADNSAVQMMRYLDNVGYFHSKVTHTVDFKKRKKLAKVTYHVYPTQPYRINKINYIILAISMAIIVIGFILMSGSGSTETAFNEDIFSPIRIKVAPIVCFIGFIGIIFGIMFHNKEAKKS